MVETMKGKSCCASPGLIIVKSRERSGDGAVTTHGKCFACGASVSYEVALDESGVFPIKEILK